jgi:purine-binding chemotaxis protein CheW
VTVETAAAGSGQVNLACFEVGGRQYALDVTLVREIVRPAEITPLPDAPLLIEGVAELRGGMVPILDLGRVLGGEHSVESTKSRIVVLEQDGLSVGLAVEAAADVLSLDAAVLENVPELAIQTGYDVVCAVARRPDSPPVMVLSLDSILEKVHRSALRQPSQGDEAL